MEALVAAITKIDNVAILILLLVCGGLWYTLNSQRKEEREDRKQMLEAFGSIKDAITDSKIAFAASITDIKIAIAALKKGD